MRIQWRHGEFTDVLDEFSDEEIRHQALIRNIFRNIF